MERLVILSDIHGNRWALDVDAYLAAFERGIPLNREAAPMLDALRRPSPT